MKPSMVSLTPDLPGYRIVENIGVVRGIVVRSRSVVGNFAASLQTLFGGNITVYTNLCEQARLQAYDMMCDQAAANGANAVVMMRYGENPLAVTQAIKAKIAQLQPGLPAMVCG